MFERCSSLKELNLSNFNTNNLIAMRSMFEECSSLRELNLSNFNTDKVSYSIFMFHGCSSKLILICANNLIREEYKRLFI